MSYFFGGPLDGQQRKVDGDPLEYRCRVRELMPSCTLAAYMQNYPVTSKAPILHGYRRNVYGNYNYVGHV